MIHSRPGRPKAGQGLVMMMVTMMVMKIRIEFVDGCVCPREFVETENSKISLLVNQNQLSYVCTTTNYTNVNYNCLLFATLGQSEKKSFSENREKQLRQIRSRPPLPPPPIQISSCLDGLKYDSPNQSYIVFQLVFGADKWMVREDGKKLHLWIWEIQMRKFSKVYR